MATEHGVRVAITRAMDGLSAALREFDDPVLVASGLGRADANLQAAMGMLARIPGPQWGSSREGCADQ